MTRTGYDPRRHHRRSIRLKGYDYRQPGAYFVTICAQGGECLFGQVRDGRMHLSPGGEMVWRWWRALEDKYPSVRIDAAVVMPNHFHGIVVITGDATGQARGPAPTGADGHTTVGATPGGRPVDGHPMDGHADVGVGGDATGSGQVPGQARRPAPTDADGNTMVGATPGGRPDGDADERNPILGQIVGWFKTMTTNEYIRGVKQLGWPPFPGRLWQRNYYEHIVRSSESLERIRAYIHANPERWALDRENPARTGQDDLESWIYSSPARKEGQP